jgi:hypothetical protein
MMTGEGKQCPVISPQVLPAFVGFEGKKGGGSKQRDAYNVRSQKIINGRRAAK